MSEDYRKILAETEDFMDWVENLEEEIKAQSWKCFHKDTQMVAYINNNGEIRIIGMPYINKQFKKEI